MDGLGTLKRLDVLEIHKKTHISITEIKAFLNKDFAPFNRTKALGFIKILEREYDLDLSELQNEFESFQAVHNESNEQIFVVAKDEKAALGKWVVVVAILLVLLLAIGYLSFAQPASRVASTGTTSPAPSSLIAQAQEVITLPKEEAAPQVLPEGVVQEGAFASAPTPASAPASAAAGQTPAPAAPLANGAFAPVRQSNFYVTSAKDLWIGIYYLDNEHREQITATGRHDFDPERPQIVTFGHGEFRLVYGNQVIEPNSGYVQRLRFRNGEATPLPTASQIRREQEARGIVPPVTD
ncbi:hypothetical protein FACS1894103_0570 [Campylobacterota bacterium]|nr:hypothetical protein FACS1894103_0540 [Campylobacterota bacterium]GHV58686.1 hypothetical protein FACS1894103_0570 [Campylobacterota bacterium]